jgi:uncharacterized membrane protein
MRWLMIGLLVSLVALLVAAAGGARHIWIQRSKLNRKPAAGAGEPNSRALNSKQNPSQTLNNDPSDESDL